ncbi:hypothetical protein FGG79_00550 [Bacillus sp. BHET2]|uniref:hypothetical protein n=1 Tax=Bacillus sp. BHET2 TaxID=2583818 RepID=UPI00110F4054|nr:hypothetical protein [Bacillus sp. BHET2]TMU86673.1 hypothetical protein FGG79_00550 [Bacillus sp. BHET2]
MKEIALAFGNIFGGIALIAMLASLWGKFEIFFINKLTAFRQQLFFLSLTLFIETLFNTSIYFFYHLAFLDALFISSTFFLFVSWVIPYHSHFNMNTDILFLKKFGLSSPIKIFTPSYSPFFVGTLLFSAGGLLVTFCWYYLF